MNLSHILTGIGGKPEIGRLLLVVGVAATIIVPPIYLLAGGNHA